MTTQAELTLDFHGITLKAEFDFYADDLSVDINCLTVIVDGKEVDEITELVNEQGLQEICGDIVKDYLKRKDWTDEQIKTILTLAGYSAN